jgi:hypothetical protein
MTLGNWRSLGEFSASSSGSLTRHLMMAVQELALPEAFLTRLGRTTAGAARAAREREPETPVKINVLVARRPNAGGPQQCWGSFRLERVVEQPARLTEIQVFLFPDE